MYYYCCIIIKSPHHHGRNNKLIIVVVLLVRSQCFLFFQYQKAHINPNVHLTGDFIQDCRRHVETRQDGDARRDGSTRKALRQPVAILVQPIAIADNTVIKYTWCQTFFYPRLGGVENTYGLCRKTCCDWGIKLLLSPMHIMIEEGIRL